MTEPQPDQSERRSVMRGAGVMTLMTALSRVLGLVREQVRSYYLGTGMASDAFGIASVLPNLLRRLFAEGAMTAAFVPVFADYRKNHTPEALHGFLSRFVTWLTFVVTAVTLVAFALTPWLIDTLFPALGAGSEKSLLTATLARVMWPYLLLVSLAAVAQAVLNSFRIFAPSAFTPVLLNLVIIGTVVLGSEWFGDPSMAFAWGFVGGGVMQLAFQLPYLKRQGIRLRMDWTLGPGVKRVLRISLPGIFAAGIYQINVLVSQFVATTLAEGAVASLQYSLRLQELVLGLFAVSVTTVILPVMSDQVVSGNREGLKDTLRFATEIVAFVTIPASIGLILLGEPIVKSLFQFGQFDEESTRMTVFPLVFHSAGIFFIAWSRILTQVFYAQEDLRTPTRIAGGIMILHGVLCFALAAPLQQGGIALAGGIAAAINSVALFVLIRKQLGALGGRKLLVSLGRTFGCALLMAGSILALDYLLPMGVSRTSWILHLALRVAVGILVFVGAARGLRSPELEEVTRMVLRRKKA